jgi:hypothetical protein
MHLSTLSLVAFFTTAASFTVHPLNSVGVSVSRVTRRSSRSDQGWNNDNFLDALGGGEPARDAANQQYQRESANRAASRDRRFQSMMGEGSDEPDIAALFGGKVAGMPDKPPKAPETDEENPMGGQIFKQMMEKAEKGPSRIAAKSEAEPEERAPRAIYPPQAPTAAPVKAVDPNAMAYYQQQLQVWQQQMTTYSQFIASNPEAAAEMTMPLPPQPPFGIGGPKAKEVPVDDPKNYLPKGSGNKDSYEITGPADIYFAQLKRDSFVRSEARKAGDMDVANNPFADVGVKALTTILSDELIKQRRDRLAENGGEFETSRDEMILPYEEDDMDIDVSYTGISYKQKLMDMKKKAAGRIPQAAAAVVSAPTPMPVVVQEPEPVVVPTAEAVTIAQAEEVKEEEEGKPNFALDVSEDFDGAVVPAPSMEDAEESRTSIRTLMGLILKHRGGSGFGHGRLAEAEAVKLTENVNEVLALLRSEGGMEAPAPAFTTPSMDAMSPPLAGTVACAEAALNMYKTADSGSQKDLMIPVREALMNAINNLDKEITGSSSSEVSSEAPPSPVYATTMEFPDTYKVTKPKEETITMTMTKPVEAEIAVAPAPSGTDRNTEVLQNVFETLKSAVGDEKYGLREIGSDEVAHIKDVLLDMRSVLMDELDNGIPE